MDTTVRPEHGRGCGDRSAGGTYLCTGQSLWGRPIEDFIIDPVKSWPGDFQRGFKVIPGPNGVNHVVIFVGESFYASPWTFIEEAKRFGVSRKVPPTFPFHMLTPHRSQMIFVHSKAWLGESSEVSYSLDRPENKPLKGCRYYQDDQAVWDTYAYNLGGGWHPSVRIVKGETQNTPCTFAHQDLACLLHPESDLSFEDNEESQTFTVHCPSFDYQGKVPVLPNYLKGEKLVASPGVFLKVYLTHVEFPKVANKQSEQAAQMAGFETVVLDW